MSLAWLSAPVELHSSRAFECDPLTTEECDWYKQHWHYWYEKPVILETCDQLTYLHQVHSWLCFCAANSGVFHVCHWHLHNWPLYFIAGAWISQIPWASLMAETDCNYSILILPWFSREVASMELSPCWSLAIRTCWDNFLLL